MSYCPSCRSTHMAPVPCGLTFIERMRSVRLDPRATPTKSRRSYYDPEPVNAVFGPDAREELLHETDGRGSLRRHPRTGEFFRTDRHTGETVKADPSDLAFFTGAGTETDG